MAELPDVLLPVVHVAPIWPKPKRITSFKQAALIVLKLIQLGECAKPSKLTVEFMTEQLKELANEDPKKEERLRQVQCMARTKQQTDPHEKERREQFMKAYREKFRFLDFLKKMDHSIGNHWLNNSTSNAASFEKLRHFDIEGRKLGSLSCMQSLINIAKERKAITPTTRLVQDYELERSTSVTGKINKGTTEPNSAKGRTEQGYVSLSASPTNTGMKSQPSCMDGTHDPRFQNLLRSLTPIN